MTDNKEKSDMHLVKDNATEGSDRIDKMFDHLGGETGVLAPMVKMLKKLVEDPILRQSLESAPQTDNSKKN